MSDAHGHIELERRVDSIKVGVRHRSDAERDLAPLMRSIERLGLLQPVTITPDGMLVCGHRRLAAVKQLGWPTLRVWVRTGVSDHLTQLLAEQEIGRANVGTPVTNAHLVCRLLLGKKK